MKRSKFLKILGVATVAPIAIAKAVEGIAEASNDNLIPGGGNVKEAFLLDEKCRFYFEPRPGELITMADGTKVYYTPWHILDDPDFFEKYPIKKSKVIKLILNQPVLGNYENTIT